MLLCRHRYSVRRPHQRSLKVWRWRWSPGGRDNAVEILLLGVVYRLHEERRAVLGLRVRLLLINAAVKAAVAVLCKEGIDGFYSGL